MRLFLTILLLCLGIPAAAGAQTLDRALQTKFADGDGPMKLLRESGAEFGGLLTLERLPSGDYAAEIEIAVGDAEARYPLKLRRESVAWRVVWQPEATYAAALVGILKSGELPSARAASRWTEVDRLPALPIIGTRKRFVTPFGEVPVDDRAEGKSQGDLDLSPRLVDHVHRWVRSYLAEDPAPAGVDLILDRQSSWKLANKLLFNTSVVGLYQISLVTGDSGQLGVVQVASPVAARKGEGPPTVVAIYPLEDEFGVRISVKGEPEDAEGCEQGMNLRIEEPGELPGELERFVPPGGDHAMFAASGDTTVGEAVGFFAAFVDYMGLGDHEILMGYVQR